jgi:hypothetical protein
MSTADTALVPREHEIAQRTPANILDVIRFAVESPDVNVDKLAALVALHERIEERNAKVEFDAAMARLQARLPRITESGRIEINGRLQSRYALYEDIDAVIRPLLTDEGFSLSFDSDMKDGQVAMAGTVAHRLGHRETKRLILPIDISGNKNKTQAMGSTLSYGKRYLLALLLNIVTVSEDNDAQGDTNLAITTDQAIVLNDLIAETKSNLAKFCEWLKVASVAKIPRRDYDKARAMLERKRK